MTDEQPEGFRVTDRRRIVEPMGEVTDPLHPLLAESGADPSDPLFADVVEQLRREYRPGVPVDVAPPLPDEVERALRAGAQRATDLLRSATGRDDLVAEFDTRPLVDPLPTATYLAACHECGELTRSQGAVSVDPVTFATQADRDRWANAHAADRGHRVTLAVQSPGAGSTMTGYAEPPPAPPPGGPLEQALRRRAAAGPRPPLLAFVVPEGGRPDLICRIPNRAGAAWLQYAAHACLLGRQGSAGIGEPHRAVYSARVKPNLSDDTWRVRIDGVIGANDPDYGKPIGTMYAVSNDASMPDVEAQVEAIITRTYDLPAHTFSVLCISDVPPGDPPDPDADDYLRARRTRGCTPECDDGRHTDEPGCLRYAEKPPP